VGIFPLALGGIGLLLRGSVVLHLAVLFRPDRIMQQVTDQQVRIGRGLFTLAGFGGLKREFHHYEGPLPPAFLIVSNHQSLADIPLIPQLFPRHHVRFVAKSQLKHGVPYVSLALRVGRHAVISRTSDYRAGRRTLARFAALSAEGVCPMVFPEGRRSRSGEIEEFQSGAFRIILERSPMPVLSVAVDGGYRIASLGRLVTRIRGTVYRAQPLTLYPAPHGKKQILELLETIKEEITVQVRRWREAPAAGRAKSAGQ
jgi:1-acyl-sn-glycerol-3-phosphate acyltransferase